VKNRTSNCAASRERMGGSWKTKRRCRAFGGWGGIRVFSNQ